jgi:hypothetical protein
VGVLARCDRRRGGRRREHGRNGQALFSNPRLREQDVRFHLRLALPAAVALHDERGIAPGASDQQSEEDKVMNQLITQDSIIEELQIRGMTYTPLSLQLPANTTFEDWADIGKKLCRVGHVMNWWIADWAAFGNTKWPPLGDGEKQIGSEEKHYGALKRFAEANGWAGKTVWNAASVARKVETSRRREELSFGHHECVSALPAAKQVELLQKASQDGIPVGQLRAMVKNMRGKVDAKKPDGLVFRHIFGHIDVLMVFIRKQPESFWEPEIKARWKRELKELAEFYNSL